MVDRALGRFPAVILFRHGQTDHNASRRFQGQSPTPLNDKGRDQGRRAGELVANLLSRLLPAGSVVVESITSDLPRAHDTAMLVANAIVNRGFGSVDFRDDITLREFNIGGLQEHTVEEFEAARPGVLPKFYLDYEKDPYGTRYPGECGESRRMLAARLAHLVRRVNQKWQALAPTGENPMDMPMNSSDELLKMPFDLHLWSAHGGVIDTLLELMGGELGGERRIVGNGDVLMLVPTGSGTVKSPALLSPLAREMECDARWRIFRHYQVGDNVAAKINPLAVKVKL